MSKTTTYKPLNPTELIDTTGMDNDTWLKIREHGLGEKPTDPDYIPYTITGSGASAALGVNPWVSDEEYRDKKMGVKAVLDVAFSEESKAAGHVFEPFVAINFMRYMHMNFPEVFFCFVVFFYKTLVFAFQFCTTIRILEVPLKIVICNSNTALKCFTTLFFCLFYRHSIIHIKQK